MADILYVYKTSIYANLTNKCPCRCTFCIRNNTDSVGSADTLWHKHDPSMEDIKKAVDDFDFTSPTIIIADRGYESFNVYEHIKKSGQKFLIRAKDTKSNGLLNGLDLPSDGTFLTS